MMSEQELDRRFNYHAPPDEDTRFTHERIRENCRGLADFLNRKLPDGREKHLAFTHLEEVMFWGNAAVARENYDN